MTGLADTVLMIRPASFGFNPDAARTNASARPPTSADVDLQGLAAAEHAGVVEALRREGVRVELFDDTPDPPKPDAVFPNNWISLHEDGTVVLYPMCAPSRRPERRRDIVDALAARHRVDRVLDLSGEEEHGEFLEGTGSLVLDRRNRVVYASVSPRTSPALVRRFCREMEYEPVLCHGWVDGAPPYHTNVMMAIGADFAVLAEHTLPDPAERARVRARLEDTGHAVLTVSPSSYACFAGNLLPLRTGGGTCIVLSTRALASLSVGEAETLASYGRLVPVALPTIERIGGGSARCLLAEVFLPREPRPP